ncbi:hypothetical protein M128_0218 [Bacteroides fragilis str. S6L8]|uniref:Uncharacterized protein n=1 Tax=Bacteroides fragilis str. S36L11 TaxID=1339327 RepID=A0A015YFD8_BACFG|nr:hypothetical protein M074_0220 [Bacteroides fragilis str. DS-166]EXZ30622.1 hypothetical protein M136_0159 [Bacteroides fragilis str. S36L11]EYA11507.1 hypothetical protein M130_0215 [Bacteroides fragilis str. S6R6]EYA93132.1 hypothetical protein M135_0281 [Bacteroides fragilis str. S36L5]EYB02270.1 hypothetical protein M128_0218 [Bacteroides fragilis str. S6L8]EYB07007.1 hypothetical protein M129_0219 [Bacteroides fragilis str. S6R5]
MAYYEIHIISYYNSETKNSVKKQKLKQISLYNKMIWNMHLK